MKRKLKLTRKNTVRSVKRQPLPVRIPPPSVVFEFAMTQLILRGAGFKSSELSTVIREVKDKPAQSSVHVFVLRDGKRFSLGVGEIDLPLPKVKASWYTWLGDVTPYIIRNFEEAQKNSIAFNGMENILTSLENAGFLIKDSPLEESFDIANQIH